MAGEAGDSSMMPGLRSLLLVLASAACAMGAEYNVKTFGAVGDGRAIDSDAINRAIGAAQAAGGGTVVLPAGEYLSYSIRLCSNLTLQLDHGCTLIAATPGGGRGYDPAEPNPWGDKYQYQDFGHSHWHNSLIWGENLHDVTITGAGLIDGHALVRVFLAPGGLPRGGGNALNALRHTGPDGTASGRPELGAFTDDGKLADYPVSLAGNKAIALVRCHQVTLSNFKMLLCGHFAVLTTGVDHLTIDNLSVDTRHDGFDLDGCSDLRIVGCRVNSPNDDAIVMKSSYALGELRPCDRVSILRCTVSGFDAGTALNGRQGRTMERAFDGDGPTGRIKIGTESTGSFHDIRIDECRFVHSRGLALETVDGGDIENVTATNLHMEEVSNAPIFLRVGARLRGPPGRPPGKMRHIRIEHLDATGIDARFPLIIAGLPDAKIEDVSISDVRLAWRGTLSQAEWMHPDASLINPFFAHGPEFSSPRDPRRPPEQRRGYPEPSMFGLLPASVLYIRHASNIAVSGLTVSFPGPDSRPRLVADDVALTAIGHL